MLNLFTIVLQGMPHIKRHLGVFSRLPFPWHWSVCYGIADPVGDTSRCQPIDHIDDDGTLKYLYEIEICQNVTIQRQAHWPGKTAMCNAALGAFKEPGILLQVDADEYWRTDQLAVLPALFEAYPGCDMACFYCRMFVGPKRIVTQPNNWGNHNGYEWCRAWKWKPGLFFERHEPPILQGQKIGLPHDLTACAGLVFDHMGYVSEEQVAFKSRYYGYENGVEAWKRLCAVKGPAKVRDYLPWVHEDVVSYEIP